MQLREYLLQMVPVEELTKYPTLVELAEKTEATVEELRAQGRAMMSDFEARYAAREAKYESYTLVAWAAAIRQEMQKADAKLRDEMQKADATYRAEMHEANASLRADMGEFRGQMAVDFARWANTIIETLRANWRAQLEPHDGAPERRSA
jgi:hypothetical protein